MVMLNYFDLVSKGEVKGNYCIDLVQFVTWVN